MGVFRFFSRREDWDLEFIDFGVFSFRRRGVMGVGRGVRFRGRYI